MPDPPMDVSFRYSGLCSWLITLPRWHTRRQYVPLPYTYDGNTLRLEVGSAVHDH